MWEHATVLFFYAIFQEKRKEADEMDEILALVIGLLIVKKILRG